jgi:hypothetical protein
MVSVEIDVPSRSVVSAAVVASGVPSRPALEARSTVGNSMTYESLGHPGRDAGIRGVFVV